MKEDINEEVAKDKASLKEILGQIDFKFKRLQPDDEKRVSKKLKVLLDEDSDGSIEFTKNGSGITFKVPRLVHFIGIKFKSKPQGGFKISYLDGANKTQSAKLAAEEKWDSGVFYQEYVIDNFCKNLWFSDESMKIFRRSKVKEISIIQESLENSVALAKELSRFRIEMKKLSVETSKRLDSILAKHKSLRDDEEARKGRVSDLTAMKAQLETEIKEKEEAKEALKKKLSDLETDL